MIPDFADKYPYFITRDENSNFINLLNVFNNQFTGLRSSILNLKEGFGLNKKVLIHREQFDDNNYKIIFNSFYNAKKIELFKNDNLIIVDNNPTNPYTYIYNSVSDEIIPVDTFKIRITTTEGYIIEKGYPENDNPKNDIFDHDESLDTIGLLIDCPRRNYKVVDVTDYAFTNPLYCNTLTESDYDYLYRLIEYTERYWNMPLPCLKLWQHYNLESKLVNRRSKLCIQNESYMGTNSESVFVYADLNNNNPFINTNLNLVAYGLNSKGDKVKGQYAIYKKSSVYDSETEEYVFDDYYRFTGFINEYNTKITEANPFNLIVKFFSIESILPDVGSVLEKNIDDNLSQEYFISVRSSADSDWFVATTGDDSDTGKSLNHAFATLEKAVSVSNHGDIIYIDNGEYNLTESIWLNHDLFILGSDDDTIINVPYTAFYINGNGRSLYLQDLLLCNDDEILNYNTNPSLLTNTGRTFVEINVGTVSPITPTPILNFTISDNLLLGEEYLVIVTNIGDDVDGSIVKFFDDNNNLIDTAIMIEDTCSITWTPSFSGVQNITVYIPSINYTKSKQVYVLNPTYLADYYVSSDGSDTTGDGTLTNPFETITKALTVADEEDILSLLTDITISNPVIIDKSIIITQASVETDKYKITNISEDYFILNKECKLTLENINLGTNSISNTSFTNSNTDTKNVLITTRRFTND